MPRPAARDGRLVLSQAGHHWTLGTADAADGDESRDISWTVALPVDLEAGPATLTAQTAELNVMTAPRAS